MGRLRVIPVWTAWDFALSTMATILIFPIHNSVIQETLKHLVCALLFIGRFSIRVRGDSPIMSASDCSSLAWRQPRRHGFSNT